MTKMARAGTKAKTRLSLTLEVMIMMMAGVIAAVATAAAYQGNQITKETAASWLKSIRGKADEAERALNPASIEEAFNSVHCDIEQIDGDTIVDGLKEFIEGVVDKCVTTADNIAKALSETELPETVNESALLFYDSCSEWLPAGEALQHSRPLSDLDMVTTNRGGTMDVNLSHSSVILLGPTSSQRTSIQKDIQRTAALDEVFM